MSTTGKYDSQEASRSQYGSNESADESKHTVQSRTSQKNTPTYKDVLKQDHDEKSATSDKDEKGDNKKNRKNKLEFQNKGVAHRGEHEFQNKGVGAIHKQQEQTDTEYCKRCAERDREQQEHTRSRNADNQRSFGEDREYRRQDYSSRQDDRQYARQQQQYDLQDRERHTRDEDNRQHRTKVQGDSYLSQQQRTKNQDDRQMKDQDIRQDYRTRTQDDREDYQQRMRSNQQQQQHMRDSDLQQEYIRAGNTDNELFVGRDREYSRQDYLSRQFGRQDDDLQDYERRAKEDSNREYHTKIQGDSFQLQQREQRTRDQDDRQVKDQDDRQSYRTRGQDDRQRKEEYDRQDYRQRMRTNQQQQQQYMPVRDSDFRQNYQVGMGAGRDYRDYQQYSYGTDTSSQNERTTDLDYRRRQQQTMSDPHTRFGDDQLHGRMGDERWHDFYWQNLL